MNLLCPNCQKMLTVPDQQAGQQMQCPHCGASFAAPMLPMAGMLPAAGPGPSQAPTPPLPAPSLPRASATASSSSASEVEVYPLSADSPRASSPLPLIVPTSGPKVAREDPRPQAESKEPPPPPPTGVVHEFTFTLGPRLTSWVTPVAACLLLILLFCPWIGAYPGGYGVYTQSGLQLIWGSYSLDAVGEKVLRKDKDINAAIHGNWLMLFYPLVVLAVAALAILPLLRHQTPLRLPTLVDTLWPQRTLLLAAAALFGLFLLLFQLYSGFGLANALHDLAAKSIANPENPPPTPEEQTIARIQRGQEFGRYQVQSTLWLEAAIVCHLLVLGAALGEYWFARRGERAAPQMRVCW